VAIDTRVPVRDDTGIGAQWAANLLGPVAVLLGLELAYAFVHPACRSGNLLPVHLSFAGALALALVGTAVGWRQWRRWGSTWPGEEAGPEPRGRFMATIGLLAGAFSALVLAAQWLATVFLHPCQ
jgi:hypothetical protein